MDPEKEIIEDLQAPFKSFRIFALEQAIKKGNSEELLKILEGLREQETDEECLNLLPYAIEAVRERIRGGESLAFDLSKVSAQTFPEHYSQATSSVRLRMLLGLPREYVPELVKWAVEEVKKEKNPAILSQIFSTFGLSWPMDQLQILLDNLFGNYVGIRVAVLETLIAISPYRLVSYFPKLFQEEDPRIMATTIKGLAKIDEDEAKRYIESELLGRNPLRKNAILRVATGLPFKLVKESLLKFLSTEKEITLLEKAGLIFHINPDLEVPYRLLDLLKNADSKKMPILKETFEGACKIIENSGMLGKGFSEYLSKLEEASNKYGVFKTIQMAVAKLDSEDESEREESQYLLSGIQKKPFFDEAVKKSADIAFSDVQREKMKELAKIPSEKTDRKSKLEKPTSDFFTLSEPDQCRWFAGLDLEEREKSREIFFTVLKNDSFSHKLKAIALRAALRLEMTDFKEFANRWIYHSNESLVAASLEYLAKIDPEKVFPLLGRFQKSPSLRIRIAAMKILWLQDPRQAISSILEFLKSPNPRTRSTAFSAMMSFDFSLIRESVVEILEASKDIEILDPVLLLFQNNPAPENIFLLYRLEKAFSEQISQKIYSVRLENVSLIENLKLMPEAELKALLDSLPQKLAELLSRKASSPSYSFEILKSLPKKIPGTGEILSGSVKQIAILILLGVFVFTCLWFGIAALIGSGFD